MTSTESEAQTQNKTEAQTANQTENQTEKMTTSEPGPTLAPAQDNQQFRQLVRGSGHLRQERRC